MLYINFKQGFLESRDRASCWTAQGTLNCKQKAKGGFFLFLWVLKNYFALPLSGVSMETSLLKMCSSSEPSLWTQAEDRPEASYIYFSAAMSWQNQERTVIFIKKSVYMKMSIMSLMNKHWVFRWYLKSSFCLQVNIMQVYIRFFFTSLVAQW